MMIQMQKVLILKKVKIDFQKKEKISKKIKFKNYNNNFHSKKFL